MLPVVLLLVSTAGAMSVGGPQELRTDEVMVMCPLSEDVRLTKRDVVISYFSNIDHPNPDTMLGCVWPERDPLNPDCRSRFNFTLVSLKKDYVMARVPRAKQHKEGFYQCQLVPAPDADHVFSRCLVHDNDDTEDPTTILSPVIPATDQPWPRDPMEKVLTGDHPRDNSVAAVGLTLAGVSLLVLVVVFVAFMILRHRRHRRTVSQTSETSLEKRTVPWTSGTSLEKEQQPLMRTLPGTAETSLEKEQQPLMSEQRLSEIIYLLGVLSRGPVPWTSETSLEREQQPLMRPVPLTSEPSLEKEQQPLMRTAPLTSEPSLEKEQQPLMTTAPLTSEPSLEKEQQPLMRMVPPTSEPSLEKESVQNVQRASGLSQDCKQKLRRFAEQVAERDRERPEQSRRRAEQVAERDRERPEQSRSGPLYVPKSDADVPKSDADVPKSDPAQRS